MTADGIKAVLNGSFSFLTFADASTIIMLSVGFGYELSQRKNNLSRFP